MTMSNMDDNSDSRNVDKWLPSDPKGHKAIRVMRRLVLAGILLDIVVGVFVATRVPLETTILYTRLSREIQIPIISLLGFPLVLSLWWLKSRRAAFEPLPPKERRLLLVVTIPVYASMVLGQLFLANAYLEAASQIS